jgi:hypothetical protein
MLTSFISNAIGPVLAIGHPLRAMLPPFERLRVSFLAEPSVELTIKFKDSQVTLMKMKGTGLGRKVADMLEKKLIDELKKSAQFPNHIDLPIRDDLGSGSRNPPREVA